MGGGSKSQPTTQQVVQNTSEPAAWQKPILEKVGSEGLSQFNSGSMNFQPYQGNTVVPYSAETNQAMDQLRALGQGGAENIDLANSQVGNILGQGGINSQQQGQIDNMARVAGGGYRPEQALGVQGLMQTASGADIGNNPYLDRIINRGVTEIGRSTNDMMGSAGRYGSGAHQNTLQDNVGDFVNNAMFQDMEAGRNRQMSAQGQLIGAGQSQDSLATGAAGSAFNALNTGNQNVFQAAGMSPSLYTAQGLPSEFLMDVGSMQEDLSARQLDEQIARHDASEMGDYNALLRLAGIGQGMGQAGASSTSTTRAPSTQPSTAAGALGGAMTGASMGSAFGPWGTGIGAIGGGILGGFF